MRLHSFTSFEESVEICVRLNVNPKNGEQIVRGTANLPAGLGKTIKTAVLCSDDEWEELQNLKVKVDFHLTEEKIKKVKFVEFSSKKNLSSLRNFSQRLRTCPRSSTSVNSSVPKD
jgi:large subunit ribosomal protein L1